MTYYCTMSIKLLSKIPEYFHTTVNVQLVPKFTSRAENLLPVRLDFPLISKPRNARILQKFKEFYAVCGVEGGSSGANLPVRSN